MSTNRDKPLSAEDRILWHRVARTVTPMVGKKPPPVYGESEQTRIVEPVSENPQHPKSDEQGRKRRVPDHQPARPQTIDRPVRNKIAAGRISVDARIDLHGMTQHQAHNILLDFLHRAFAMHMRHVLVITGKGASHGSDGVLRRAVPEWLATPSFNPFVSGYSDAARQHGGAGALYVRLRRADRGKRL